MAQLRYGRGIQAHQQECCRAVRHVVRQLRRWRTGAVSSRLCCHLHGPIGRGSPGEAHSQVDRRSVLRTARPFVAREIHSRHRRQQVQRRVLDTLGCCFAQQNAVRAVHAQQGAWLAVCVQYEVQHAGLGNLDLASRDVAWHGAGKRLLLLSTGGHHDHQRQRAQSARGKKDRLRSSDHQLSSWLGMGCEVLSVRASVRAARMG